MEACHKLVMEQRVVWELLLASKIFDWGLRPAGEQKPEQAKHEDQGRRIKWAHSEKSQGRPPDPQNLTEVDQANTEFLNWGEERWSKLEVICVWRGTSASLEQGAGGHMTGYSSLCASRLTFLREGILKVVANNERSVLVVFEGWGIDICTRMYVLKTEHAKWFYDVNLICIMESCCRVAYMTLSARTWPRTYLTPPAISPPRRRMFL